MESSQDLVYKTLFSIVCLRWYIKVALTRLKALYTFPISKPLTMVKDIHSYDDFKKIVGALYPQ